MSRHPTPQATRSNSSLRFALRPTAIAVHLLLAGVAVGGWVGAAQAQTATAASTRSYNIPAGPLNVVLTRFLGESGVLLSGSTALARGKQSPGLRGHFGPDAALAALLHDTGLHAVADKRGRFTLQLANEADRTGTTEPNTRTGSEKVLPAITVTTGTTSEYDSFITQGRTSGVGKSKVAVQDTPFSISVIDVKRIREKGAKNVQDALGYSAGVYSGRYGFDTRGDWSAIRGLSPSAYIDGLRGSYGAYNSTRPDIYTLSSIEVLKGPASVLYGQGDLGGIINVVTKRPQELTEKEIEVQLGSHKRKQIATDLTGPLNADGSLLYRLVAVKRDSDTQVDYVNDDAFIVMPTLTWRPTVDTSLTLQYVHHINDTKVSAQFLPSKGTIDPAPRGQIPSNRFVGEPGWDRYDTRKDEVSLFWDQKLVHDWGVAANLRKTTSSSETREHWTTVGAIPDDAGNIPRTIYTSDRKTDVLAGDVRLEGVANLGSTRHTITIGIDYQDATWEEFNYSYSAAGGGLFNVYNPIYGFVNTTALTFSDRPDNRIIQTGIYLLDHIEWESWIMSVAMRQDHARNEVLNVSGPDTIVRNSATTGRVGLMYRFKNGLSPYVSWSSSFLPNLGTDGTASAAFLKPTTGEQKEAGWKYLSPSGDSSLAFAWFQIEQQNRIADGATPGGKEQVRAETDGWEIEARHRAGQLELSANYTKLDAINPSNNTRLSSIPNVTASAWLQYEFTSGMRAGVGGRHIGSTTGNSGRPTVPSVTLYDAMLSYSTRPWDMRLTVQNIANKDYVSWCRGLNQDCGYGEGRSLLVTASYKF